MAYIATREVATLEHEVGNHTMEDGSLVALAWGLGLGQCPEVLCRLWHHVVEELEVYTAFLC